MTSPSSGGYFCVGDCVGCGDTFAFNPHHVPSIRVTRTVPKRVPNPVGSGFATALERELGPREPVCEACFKLRQDHRLANGLPEEPLHPKAYEPEPEDGDDDG